MFNSACRGVALFALATLTMGVNSCPSDEPVKPASSLAFVESVEASGHLVVAAGDWYSNPHVLTLENRTSAHLWSVSESGLESFADVDISPYCTYSSTPRAVFNGTRVHITCEGTLLSWEVIEDAVLSTTIEEVQISDLTSAGVENEMFLTIHNEAEQMASVCRYRGLSSLWCTEIPVVATQKPSVTLHPSGDGVTVTVLDEPSESEYAWKLFHVSGDGMTVIPEPLLNGDQAPNGNLVTMSDGTIVGGGFKTAAINALESLDGGYLLDQEYAPHEVIKVLTSAEPRTAISIEKEDITLWWAEAGQISQIVNYHAPGSYTGVATVDRMVIVSGNGQLELYKMYW